MKNFAISKDSLWMYGAYWAEMLARWLLRVETITPEEWFACKNTLHFDIDEPNLNTLFEVKLSRNTGQLRIFTVQLERQLEEIGFPQSEGYLWLFSYRNRGPRREGRKLLFGNAGMESWDDLSAFLASHLSRADLVDVQVLRRLAMRENGTRFCESSLWSDPARKKSVRINRRDFTAISRNPRGLLGQLGMSSDDLSRWIPPRAHQFRPRVIRTEFDGNPVSFRLNLIVPNGFKNRFLHCLNGNVKRVEDP